MKPNKSFLIKYGILTLVLLGLYFGNVELQSYWGRQTLEKSGLELRTLKEALEVAKTSSKPVLLDVSAIWCPSCRKLDRQVLSDPKVKELIQSRYVFARMEYESEEGREILKKFNRTGFPNLMVLNGDGELLRPLQVVFEPEAFAKQLR